MNDKNQRFDGIPVEEQNDRTVHRIQENIDIIK